MTYKLNQGGFALLSIIISILIIAVLVYGSSFFLQKKNEKRMEENALRQMEELQKNINQMNMNATKALNDLATTSLDE